MPTNCEIIFENNDDRVYYGGQTIEGRVRLTLAKGKIVRGNYHIRFHLLFSSSFLLLPNVGRQKNCDKWNEFIIFLLFILQLTSQCCCFKMVNPMYRVIYEKKTSYYSLSVFSVSIIILNYKKIQMIKYAIA